MRQGTLSGGLYNGGKQQKTKDNGGADGGSDHIDKGEQERRRYNYREGANQ